MRVWVVLLLVLMTWPAQAGALTYREQRALDVAEAKWKRLPCGGNIEIVRQPTGDPDNLAAYASPPCRIIYDPSMLKRAVWPRFCTVIVHEVGHLLGYGHSPDPGSVMNETPRDYWRCST